MVIVPAMHLLFCFLYLFCYYSALGHGLIYLASPNEVFSVSLTKIAPAYLTVAIGAVLASWSYETDQEIEVRYSDERATFAKLSKEAWFWFATVIAIITGLIGALASIVSGYIFWFQLIFPLVLFISGRVGYFIGAKGYQITHLILAGSILFASMSIAVLGLIDGQHVAKVRVDISNIEAVKCNEFSIIKDVSEHFLAIDAKSNRIIINSECEPMFEVISGKDVTFLKSPDAVSEIISYFGS